MLTRVLAAIETHRAKIVANGGSAKGARGRKGAKCSGCGESSVRSELDETNIGKVYLCPNYIKTRVPCRFPRNKKRHGKYFCRRSCCSHTTRPKRMPPTRTSKRKRRAPVHDSEEGIYDYLLEGN